MKLVKREINIVFAISLAIVPIIMSLFDLVFGKCHALPYFILAWGVMYFSVLLVSAFAYILKGGKFDFSLIKKPLMIIVMLMLGWIILSSIVNKVFDENLVMYLIYFLIFLCIYMLDKKWKELVLNVLLVTIAISCLMGFVYMYTKSMPGLDNDGFYIALHFANPNYGSHLISALALVCFVKLDRSISKKWNTFYVVIYVIYATHLFVNGSFVAITSLIGIEIVVQIVLAVKTKKFRYKMLLLSLILLPICLLIELLPNIEVIRTCRYNYLLECVAVFDNTFGTDLLSKFGIEKIVGADGWDRKELLIRAWRKSTSSPKMFIFGGGAGLVYEYIPHNAIMALMLDFGVVVPVLFTTLFVLMAVKLIKNKQINERLEFILAIVCFLICYITGSIVPHSFYVFMIILGLLVSYSASEKLVN